ncbi:MAG: phosphatase PAP2 family protein [Saezia sp.]
MKAAAIDYKNIIYRLWWLLLGWGTVGCIYSFCAYIQAPGTVLTPFWIDRITPYTQEAIWPYISFFVLLPTVYLTCDFARIRWLAHAMQLCIAIAAFVYLLYPTTTLQPPIDTSTISGPVLQLLLWIDFSSNCLPSMHAALSLLAVWAMMKDNKTSSNAFFIIWFFLISLSIVMLRRHLWIDWAAGCALALSVGTLCHKWYPWSYKTKITSKRMS